MEATPDSVALGQSVTYTISVTNYGPDPARHITVSDNLPRGVTLKSISITHGKCGIVAGVPFCTLEGLAEGDSASGSITIVVDEPQDGGMLFNTIHVAASKNKGEPRRNNQAETITAIRDSQ